MSNFGPSHQSPRHHPGRAVVLTVLVAALLSRTVFDVLLLVAIARLGLFLYRRAPKPAGGRGSRPAGGGGGQQQIERARAATANGCVYLGASQNGSWRFSAPERAVLVLGPPRSGKTSAVMIPALLAHNGPAVSTSTKPDVLKASGPARSLLGQVWQFDPTGTAVQLDGVRRLRWSPLLAATSWDGALLMARALVSGTGVGAGTSDVTHWSKRAQALLAPILHAAALGGRGMRTVVEWVSAHELDEPLSILQATGASSLASSTLAGLAQTDRRERASIFSAAADALDAYSATAALEATDRPDFDPWRFVQSRDTIYIHAPADQQHLAAPLVCGLLADIRRATYEAHRCGQLPGRVLFALDELANIAPIAELPAIASEGGGQGLLLLGALQDLSQARGRWGEAADGFLTLFGSKLILGGIADSKTLESVSVMLGEYDRQLITENHSHTPGIWGTRQGHSVSTQRTRVLSPGEVASVPAGCALYLQGASWELINLTPAFASEPWRTMTAGTLR